MKVFVSYSHQQRDWVWGQLCPLLQAAGAEVLIDVERFTAGKAIVAQMDSEQDRADRQIICLSAEYLQSKNCQHEMERALQADPGFVQGKVIPIIIGTVTLPPAIQAAQPLYVKLQPGASSLNWQTLFNSLSLRLAADPRSWLDAADAISRVMGRMQCVNLVVQNGVEWQPLLRHLIETVRPTPLVPDLKTIDLSSGRCASRRGLLSELLCQAQIKTTLPNKPDDLVEFDRLFDNLPPVRMALTHWDLVATPARRDEYGDDLFASLYNLTTVRRKLSLLIVSKSPFANSLPSDHPVSAIPMDHVACKAGL